MPVELCLDPNLVKAYATDFCGVKTLREATRQQIENFVQPFRPSETDGSNNRRPRVERVGERRFRNVMETAIWQHALPNSEALDRLIRYETTIERYSSRAIENLTAYSVAGRENWFLLL